MARKLRKVCIAISFYFIFNWKSEGIVIQCQFHCEKGCRRLGNESKWGFSRTNGRVWHYSASNTKLHEAWWRLLVNEFKRRRWGWIWGCRIANRRERGNSITSLHELGTRFVAVGNIFSGLFCPVHEKPRVVTELVRKPAKTKNSEHKVCFVWTTNALEWMMCFLSEWTVNLAWRESTSQLEVK